MHHIMVIVPVTCNFNQRINEDFRIEEYEDMSETLKVLFK